MKFIEYIKRSFVVRKCIICNDAIDYERKKPLCDKCAAIWLEHLDLLCSKCGYDIDYCTCTPSTLSKKNKIPIISGAFYKSGSSSPVNIIVYKLKRDYLKEVIDFCAQVMKEKTIMMCKRLNIDYRNNFIVTYPPRRKSGKRKYGYDHTKLLAKAYAEKMGFKVVSCFDNTGKSEQKRLSKHDRVINAANSYIIKEIDLKGKNVFLIDDIITSGATAKVCMQLLKTVGAKTVIPVTYAKDIK